MSILGKRCYEDCDVSLVSTSEDLVLDHNKRIKRVIDKWEELCKHEYGLFDVSLERKFEKDINKQTKNNDVQGEKLPVPYCTRELRVCIERLNEKYINGFTNVLNVLENDDSTIDSEVSLETGDTTAANDGCRSNLNVTYVISKGLDKSVDGSEEEDIFFCNNPPNDVMNSREISEVVMSGKANDEEIKSKNCIIPVKSCAVSKNVLNEPVTSDNNVLKNNSCEVSSNNQPTSNAMTECETRRMEKQSKSNKKVHEISRNVTCDHNIGYIKHSKYNNMENKNNDFGVLVNNREISEFESEMEKRVLTDKSNDKHINSDNKITDKNHKSSESHVVLLEVIKLRTSLSNNSKNTVKIADQCETTSEAIACRSEKSEHMFTEKGGNNSQCNKIIKKSPGGETKKDIYRKLHHTSGSLVNKYKFGEIQNSNVSASNSCKMFNQTSRERKHVNKRHSEDTVNSSAQYKLETVSYKNNHNICKRKLYCDLRKSNELVAGDRRNKDTLRERSSGFEFEGKYLTNNNKSQEDCNSNGVCQSTDKAENVLFKNMKNSNVYEKVNIVGDYQVEGVYRLADSDSPMNTLAGEKLHNLPQKKSFDCFTNHIENNVYNKKEIVSKNANPALKKTEISTKRHNECGKDSGFSQIREHNVSDEICTQKIQPKTIYTIPKGNVHNKKGQFSMFEKSEVHKKIELFSRVSHPTLKEGEISKKIDNNVSHEVCSGKILPETPHSIPKSDIHSKKGQFSKKSEVHKKIELFSKVSHPTLKEGKISKKIDNNVSHEVCSGKIVPEISHTILKSDIHSKKGQFSMFEKSEVHKKIELFSKVSHPILGQAEEHCGSDISHSELRGNTNSRKIVNMKVSDYNSKILCPEKIQHKTPLVSKSNVFSGNEINDNTKSTKSIFNRENKEMSKKVSKKYFNSEPENSISLKSLSPFEAQKIKEIKKNIKNKTATGKFMWTYGNRIYYFTKETANGKVVVDCRSVC